MDLLSATDTMPSFVKGLWGLDHLLGSLELCSNGLDRVSYSSAQTSSSAQLKVFQILSLEVPVIWSLGRGGVGGLASE